jgi:hypothetical protein
MNNDNKKLARSQVLKLLKSSECVRVSSLDIGGIFESYQLPDGRILVDYAGEGGTIYESDELENWLQESKTREAAHNDALFNAYSSKELEQFSFPERYSVSDSYPEPWLLVTGDCDNLVEKEFELSTSDKSYLISFIRYFRPLGFYREYQALSESELTEKLAELWTAEVGFEFDSADPYIDLFLLQWDFDRVWWQDVEADVCVDNEVYTAMIERFSRISRGAFLAEGISELWNSPKGEIQVSVTINNQEYHICPQVQGDWIDLQVISQINAFIEESTYQFEIVQTGTQVAFVTALTPSEKQSLQSERGWIFCDDVKL